MGGGGNGQEHVVEAGTVGGNLERGRAGLLEPAQELEDLTGRAPGGHVDGAQPAVRAHRVEAAERTRVTGQVGELQPDDLRAEPRLQLVGRPAGHDPALVEHRDRVRELVRFLQVLGGQQDRDPLVDQAPDRAPQLFSAPGVQPGGRLVQEHEGRPGDHADGQVQAAAHPAGVLGCPPVRRVRQAELGQQLPGPDPGRAPGQAQQAGHHLQVLTAGQHVVHRRELPGEADRPLHPERVGTQVVPGDGGGPRVGAHQGGQDPDHGGLARAVRAEQGQHRAGLDRQVHVIQGCVAAEGLAHALGHNCVCHTLKCMCHTQFPSTGYRAVLVSARHPRKVAG